MRVALFGYYGYGNAGDEAALGCLVAALRSAEMLPLILSADPAGSQRLHGAKAVSRSDVRTLLREAGGADAWVVGGGSLLQDVTSRRSLAFYTAVLHWVALQGTPLYFHAQGLGPIQTSLGRRWVAGLLRRSRRISVRDAEAARLARALLRRGGDVHEAADAAFALAAPGPDACREAFWQAGLDPSEGWLAVSLRPWGKTEAWLPAAVAAIRHAAERTGLRILAVPMQDAVDVPLAHQLAAALGSRAQVAGVGLAYRSRMALLAGCRLALTMRYHAAVFAALASVPGVTLAYDPKVTALAQRLGWRSVDLQRAAQGVNPLDANQVTAAIEAVAAEREAASERLVGVVNSLRRLAEADADGLIAALRTGAPSDARRSLSH